MDLKFWKNDDDQEFSFPDLPSNDMPGSEDSSAPDISSGFSAPQSEPSFSAPMQPPAAQQPPTAQPERASDDVHTQLILARLDAISNKLDVLSNRVERLESQLQSQQGSSSSSQQRGPWYANR